MKARKLSELEELAITQPDDLLATIKKVKARRNLLDFILYTKDDYAVNWHHKLICEELDAFIADPKRTRMMIFTGPRRGKSEIISRRLPAYLFGKNPNLQIIATSYGAELAQAMNRDVQRVIDSEPYKQLFPATRLSGKNVKTTSLGSYVRTSDKFEIVGYKGVYRSAGVGGGITGQGADCVKFDTLIAVEKGVKQIGDIVVGDKVQSYNHKTGQIELSVVEATRRIKSNKILKIKTKYGSEITCTEDHRFWTKEADYLPLIDVSKDYLLGRFNFFNIQDDSIESVERLEEEIDVCDIQVKENHNFFAEGILVHNCAIIDDPFKDWSEASSAKRRQLIKDWYSSTLYTRLSPNAKVIIINTRWHEDDLSGWLLKEAEVNPEADQWEVISLPEIQDEHNDYQHPKDPRKHGEVLWPTRFTESIVAKIKHSVGSKVWSALFQQRPSPDGGQIVKGEWFKYFKELPDIEYYIGSWDCSFKDTSKADYVVGQVWGVCGANKYLVYMVRERLDIVATIREMLKTTNQFKLRSMIIEDKANGPAIISMLKNKVPGLIAFNPEGSKEARANAVAPQFEAGNIWLPDKYSPSNRQDFPTVIGLLDAYVNEFKTFPNGANDDMVDATTQVLLKIGHKVSWLDELLQMSQEKEVLTPQEQRKRVVADVMGWNIEDTGESMLDGLDDDFFKIDI